MGKHGLGRNYILHIFGVLVFYSFAEMEMKQKNGISHRGWALDERWRSYALICSKRPERQP